MDLIAEDFDPHETSGEEMRSTYRRLQDNGCPVVHSDSHGGWYFLSSHAEIRKAAADWRTFSSAAGVLLPRAPIKNFALEQDPPEQTYWRAIYHEVLNPAAVKKVEPVVRRNAAELIDEFAPRGEAELVSELADIIPGNTICLILGITDPDRIRIGCRLGIQLAESNVDPAQAQAALGAFVGFCFEEIGSRRQNPRGDFLSRIANEEINGYRLTDDDLAGLLIGFFFAGHHTTTAGLSSLFYNVAASSEVRDRLIADPSLIPRAAEEAVRLDTPLHGFYRHTTTDVEISGCPIPKGSEVWLNYAAANRDPAAFENPDTFQVDRKPNPHVGFGHGIHTCVGANLSRMEMRVVTEELLARIPDITTTGEPLEYGWNAGNVMTIRRVPVKFQPTPARLSEATTPVS